jgi:hypothetical protein
LIYSPIAVLGQIPLAEQLCQLIEHIAPLIEAQFLKYHRFPQNAGSAVIVMVYRYSLFVFHKNNEFSAKLQLFPFHCLFIQDYFVNLPSE